MCDLGESIALEARSEGITQGIKQGKQMERKKILNMLEVL